MKYLLLVVLIGFAALTAQPSSAAIPKRALNPMPWPAHVEIQTGRLRITKDFNAMVRGHSASRLYGGAARLLPGHATRWFVDYSRYAPASNKTATITKSDWKPIYQGIDFATAKVDASRAYAIRVNLAAPGIRFYTTPADGPSDTVAETTSQFLEASGVQVAINGNFFSPCCKAAANARDLVGLAISNGKIVSPPLYSTSEIGGIAALLLGDHNHASIVTTKSAGSPPLANIDDALTGSAIIVRNGRNISAQSPTFGDPTHPNPRTDAGLSANGRYLYLVAIDGRKPGYSRGATLSEAADLMIALGASRAVNLDGGGSTTMVRSDGHGGASVLNRPSGGAERYVGNNLGVFAKPLHVSKRQPLSNNP
jgi:exopolysaccharide biosynthesis protein